MSELAHVGDVLAMHARHYPDKVGARDLDRAMTFRLWHSRSCRLANALLGIGLTKGDRVCVLAYNCIEWLEIYAATAMAGLIAVPINFRLVGAEIGYIVENCAAKALIVQDELLEAAEPLRAALPVPRRISSPSAPNARPAIRNYEDLIAKAKDSPPDAAVRGGDPWTLMYTSGTTGKPKGAIRSHQKGALLSLVTDVELGLSARDSALLVMPMCHANSLYFFGAFSYCGAACTVYNRKSFDPEHLVRTLAEGGATFTSLVPTHYIMMLGLPAATRARYNVDTVTKLMVSSAPARRDTKLAIMEYFKNSGPVRALRLDRGRLGHHAASRRAVHQARLGRPRMRRLQADPAARSGTAMTCPTARRASSIRAIPTPSTAIGNCRTRPRKPSAAIIARSAISPAATPTATFIWSIARAT